MTNSGSPSAKLEVYLKFNYNFLDEEDLILAQYGLKFIYIS